MRKYVFVLLALALMMLPSVVYADREEVAMVNIVEDEKPGMETLTEELFKAKNETLEKEFEQKYPQLYKAFKETLDRPYAFDMTANVIAHIDYPEGMGEDLLDIRKILGTMSMNGYVNLPKEVIDIKMDADIEAGIMEESFKGLEFIIKDKMIYTFNPFYEMWSSESLDASELSDLSFLLDGSESSLSGIAIAPLADLMTKKEITGGTHYSVRMTGEEVKKVLEDYVGMPIYDEIVKEMDASDMNFDIPKIEIDYVVKDGVIRLQHTELVLNLTIEGATVKIIIAIDGEYYSYGLQKEIETPVIESFNFDE